MHFSFSKARLFQYSPNTLVIKFVQVLGFLQTWNYVTSLCFLNTACCSFRFYLMLSIVVHIATGTFEKILPAPFSLQFLLLTLEHYSPKSRHWFFGARKIYFNTFVKFCMIMYSKLKWQSSQWPNDQELDVIYLSVHQYPTSVHLSGCSTSASQSQKAVCFQ
jgi:hypothetical protein